MNSSILYYTHTHIYVYSVQIFHHLFKNLKNKNLRVEILILKLSWKTILFQFFLMNWMFWTVTKNSVWTNIYMRVCAKMYCHYDDQSFGESGLNNFLRTLLKYFTSIEFLQVSNQMRKISIGKDFSSLPKLIFLIVSSFLLHDKYESVLKTPWRKF